MNKNDVINTIKKIIAEDLDVNLKEDEIDENASFFEEGIGLDSIAVVEFVTLLEDRFKFQFSEAEFTKDLFQNITILAELIVTKVEVK